jgi:hypothetical protein
MIMFFRKLIEIAAAFFPAARNTTGGPSQTVFSNTWASGFGIYLDGAGKDVGIAVWAVC